MKKALTIGVYNPSLIHQASPYCGDEVFAKGLEKNDYEVVRFDYRATTEPNDDLFRLAMNEKEKPDIVWIGKAERIHEETIKELRSMFPIATFVKWFADIREEPTLHDMSHNVYMDWCFGTAGGEYLKKHLLRNMKGVASIIAFTDAEFYKKMEVEDKYKSDILWTGRPSVGDNNLRNDVINSLLNKHNAKVFGLNEWLGSPEYLYYINGAKIGIGSNSFNRAKYSSDRLGNYMACGTFYLTQYFEGIEEVFERGKHLNWFCDIDEMNEKIEYYLSHEEERIKIAKEGQKFIVENFDCKPLLENLLNIIETGKSRNKWDDVYVNK